MRNREKKNPHVCGFLSDASTTPLRRIIRLKHAALMKQPDRNGTFLVPAKKSGFLHKLIVIREPDKRGAALGTPHIGYRKRRFDVLYADNRFRLTRPLLTNRRLFGIRHRRAGVLLLEMKRCRAPGNIPLALGTTKTPTHDVPPTGRSDIRRNRRKPAHSEDTAYSSGKTRTNAFLYRYFRICGV